MHSGIHLNLHFHFSRSLLCQTVSRLCWSAWFLSQFAHQQQFKPPSLASPVALPSIRVLVRIHAIILQLRIYSSLSFGASSSLPPVFWCGCGPQKTGDALGHHFHLFLLVRRLPFLFFASCFELPLSLFNHHTHTHCPDCVPSFSCRTSAVQPPSSSCSSSLVPPCSTSKHVDLLLAVSTRLLHCANSLRIRRPLTTFAASTIMCINRMFDRIRIIISDAQSAAPFSSASLLDIVFVCHRCGSCWPDSRNLVHIALQTPTPDVSSHSFRIRNGLAFRSCPRRSFS